MTRADARVLITGASGFLGRHLLDALEADPSAPRPLALVRSLDAWKGQPWVAALRRTEVVHGQLEDAHRWHGDPRVRQVATVVHLAARVAHSRSDPAALMNANVDGTRAIVELAGRLGARTVLVSTSGTVGCFRSPDERADEEAPYCEREIARWPYYASKLAAEREARAIARRSGAGLVIVRPPVLLGPGDHRLRSSGHVLRVLEERLPFRLPGGFAFVDVRDVARALVRVVGMSDPRPVYHLPGSNWTLDAFVEATARIAGRRLPRVRLGLVPTRALARAIGALPRTLAGRLALPDPVLLEMATRFWGVASRYAGDDLGHRPRPPEETLSDCVTWLERQGVVRAASRLDTQSTRGSEPGAPD